MPDLSEASFAHLLAWAYRGEVRGKVLFEELAERFSSESHRSKLLVLAELERTMARTLLPVLEKHGVDPGDDDRSRRDGRATAHALDVTGWEDLLHLFGPVTEDALARYRRLRDLSPDSDDAVLRALIAHEEALQGFARDELQDATDTSLNQVWSVISDLLKLAPTH